MTPSRTVLAARLAMAGAVTSLVLTPLHGLARFNPALGHHDLEECCAAWWGRPGLDALRPLLDWSDPYSVYLWYGRVWILLLAAATFAAFAVHAVLRPVNRTQTWAWRVLLAGLVLQTAGLAGAFLTPWLDQFYTGVALPGGLLNIVGGTVLGISSLRRGPLPRFTAIVLTLGILSEIVLSTFLYAGGAVVPMLFAWAMAGRAAARSVSAPDRAPMLADQPDIRAGKPASS
ncbi:MAG: hypothetical protein ABJA74_04705 [Lapillicoccus sp.]